MEGPAAGLEQPQAEREDIPTVDCLTEPTGATPLLPLQVELVGQAITQAQAVEVEVGLTPLTYIGPEGLGESVVF